MSTLNTRDLELFLAVAQCLNFRLAAQRLHLSQPPLSRAIRTLEERLGTPLFARNTHQVSLTPAGAKLLPQARSILQALHKAELSLKRYGQAQTLRLGLTPSLGPGLFTDLLAKLEKRLQPMGLQTTLEASPRLVALVKKKLLDAAIIAYPTSLQGLHFEALARIPQVVALASGHALARRRTLSLADLANEPVYWFARARQPAFFDHCHRVFRQQGFAPHFLPGPNDHHGLLAEVAAGKGVAIVPQSFGALKLKGVSYRPLREGDALAVGVGLLSDGGQHPGLAVLQELALRLPVCSTILQTSSLP